MLRHETVQVPQINAGGRPLRLAATHANQSMQQKLLYDPTPHEQNRDSETSQRGTQDNTNDGNIEEDETDDESFAYPITAAHYTHDRQLRSMREVLLHQPPKFMYLKKMREVDH